MDPVPLTGLHSLTLVGKDVFSPADLIWQGKEVTQGGSILSEEKGKGRKRGRDCVRGGFGGGSVRDVKWINIVMKMYKNKNGHGMGSK